MSFQVLQLILIPLYLDLQKYIKEQLFEDAGNI